MRNTKDLLMSLVATLMVCDLALVALALVPGHDQARPMDLRGGQISVPALQQPPTILAGGGGSSAVQPAFWGRIWRAIKRIGACAGCGLTGHKPWCDYCHNPPGPSNPT
jgi:hypothetical protein